MSYSIYYSNTISLVHSLATKTTKVMDLSIDCSSSYYMDNNAEQQSKTYFLYRKKNRHQISTLNLTFSLYLNTSFYLDGSQVSFISFCSNPLGKEENMAKTTNLNGLLSKYWHVITCFERQIFTHAAWHRNKIECIVTPDLIRS